MTHPIFACVNGFDPSEAVCDYAAWAARRLQKEVRLIHTLDHQVSEESAQKMTGDLTGSLNLGERDELLDELVEVEHEQNRLLLRRGKIILEKSKRRVEKDGALTIEKILLHGRLQQNLVELQNEMSLLVIGRFGQSHQNQKNSGVGHKVEGVIRSLEKPILVISESFQPPQKIMVAFDASDASMKAVHYLATTGLVKGIDVHLVTVGALAASLHPRLEEARKVLTESGHQLHQVILEGEVVDTLVNYRKSEGVDLTVMGAFSHHWLRNLLMGSMTSQILGQGPGALLLVR